jgi:hypothetical protein
MVKLTKLMGSCFHDGTYTPGDGIDFSRFVRLMYHAGWYNSRNMGKKRRRKKRKGGEKSSSSKKVPSKKVVPTSKAAVAPTPDLESGNGTTAESKNGREGKYETKV